MEINQEKSKNKIVKVTYDQDTGDIKGQLNASLSKISEKLGRIKASYIQFEKSVKNRLKQKIKIEFAEEIYNQ